MSSKWIKDLHLARDGDMAASDRLIELFLGSVDHYVREFGGYRDPDELRGELHLELVETIRNRVLTMHDDRLNRLVGARLYYRSLRHIRREKTRMSQLVINGMTEDQSHEETDLMEAIETVCDDREQQVISLLIQGYSLREVAKKMDCSHVTVLNTRRAVAEKLSEADAL